MEIVTPSRKSRKKSSATPIPSLVLVAETASAAAAAVPKAAAFAAEEERLEPGSILYGRELPLDVLATNPNTFLGLDQKHVELLMKQLDADGTLAPIAVALVTAANGSRKYLPLDGEHRTEAYRRRGRTNIIADVHVGLTPAQAAKKAMALNLHRLKARPLGILLAVRHYSDEMRTPDIAAELYVKPCYVWQCQKVLRLCPPAMFAAFVADPATYTWTVVREIAGRLGERLLPVTDENAAAVLKETMAAITADVVADAERKAGKAAPLVATPAGKAVEKLPPPVKPAGKELAGGLTPDTAPAYWAKALAAAGLSDSAAAAIITALKALPQTLAVQGVTKGEIRDAYLTIFRNSTRY